MYGSHVSGQNAGISEYDEYIVPINLVPLCAAFLLYYCGPDA